MQLGFISDVKALVVTDKSKFNALVYPYDTIRVETEVLSKKQTKRVVGYADTNGL